MMGKLSEGSRMAKKYIGWISWPDFAPSFCIKEISQYTPHNLLMGFFFHE
jgi:hypothetical protein